MSCVMGELLDSSDEAGISTARLAERVRSYLSALGGKVDLWEIGNEVNGNWTGPYPVVSAKLTAAYKEVNAAGGLDEVFWAAARPVTARAPRLRRDRHERPGHQQDDPQGDVAEAVLLWPVHQAALLCRRLFLMVSRRGLRAVYEQAALVRDAFGIKGRGAR